MRKICSNCKADNVIESQFCKSCGTRLDMHVERSSPSTVSSISEDINRSVPQTAHAHMDDVLFVPRKKKSNLKWLLAILFICVGGFMFLVFLAWLGSDESTSYDSSTYTTPTTDYGSVFPLGLLDISKIDSEWVGNTFYIKGTLSNRHTLLAKNVRIRVDFSSDEASTDIFDTRYFTVLGVPATGAYSFREALYINDPGGKFWYQAQIQSAETP